MRIQNNVNYNNPAFGTRLVVKGETARDFANALRGGFTAQGRKKQIKVIRHNDEFFILTGATDIKGFKTASKVARKAKTNLANLLKIFFESADKVDLANNPWKFILEGMEEAVARFKRALKAGALAQDDNTPFVEFKPEGTGKTYLAIGEPAKSIIQQKSFIPEFAFIETFPTKATTIHVTE